MTEPGALARARAACEPELARLGADPAVPEELGAAMRHALLAGGKRLRPALVLLAAEACGAADAIPRLVRPACAVELLHTYSLIHDDLPAMDDAPLRRGRPTCHRVFGEAVAILAGDALQALAFEVLAAPAPGVSASGRCGALFELARAAGPAGMCGGQCLDLRPGVPGDADLAALQALKTGALFRASAAIGGWLAGAAGPALEALGRYGADLGRAFQIADDVLDVVGDPAATGKAQGGDAAERKVTFAARYGLEGARRRAAEAAAAAAAALSGWGSGAEPLRALAAYAAARDR